MDWPGTLPQAFWEDSFKDEEPNLTVRDQMDSGPPIVRKVCTDNVRPFEGNMLLTPAQKIILSAFYRDNCDQTFDFPNPDTGSMITVMFAGKPTYASAIDGIYQSVTLKLKEMP